MGEREGDRGRREAKVYPPITSEHSSELAGAQDLLGEHLIEETDVQLGLHLGLHEVARRPLPSWAHPHSCRVGHSEGASLGALASPEGATTEGAASVSMETAPEGPPH